MRACRRITHSAASSRRQCLSVYPCCATSPPLSRSTHSSPPSSPGRVFSGIQPTGTPHIGNYVGAIEQWVKLQSETIPAPSSSPPNDLLFCIVDLHALTNPSPDLHASSLHTAAVLLACGIQPSRSILFRQSQVAEHSELCWLFSCVTPMGWLQRMTQFKVKSKDVSSSLGLLSYPVLQAADILLYKATRVPVGEDQHQHLELARDIGAAFNHTYGRVLFPPPATLSLGSAGSRIMSLRSADAKMSKSSKEEGSTLLLTDAPEVIRDKIKRAKTDSVAGFSYDPATRPEKSNLLTLFAAMTGEKVEDVAARYGAASAATFKAELADAVIARVGHIRPEVQRLMSDQGQLQRVLQDGADRARAIAQDTMTAVRAAVGLTA